MCFELIPAMVFCSLGIILTCLAIFQVRRERTELYIRLTILEKRFRELSNGLEQLIQEVRYGIK